MSTIFGILKTEYRTGEYNIEVWYDEHDMYTVESKASPNIINLDDLDDLDDLFERVAIRFNGGSIRWLNSIADLLPNDTKVWALDNTPQGIYTIGDIKKELYG